MDSILISVIIPTRNSSATLVRCLEAIKNQTYTKIEVIVVDNYSIDNTTDIAGRYTDKVYTIGPERSTQLNYGVDIAAGKYIYRVDSDFLVGHDVVREAVELAESNALDAILIHNTSDPTVSFWSRIRKFERDMYSSDDLHVAVRFIRKDVFLAVGGFDPNLVAGEDYDLHNRIAAKYKIGRISSKEIHLGEPKSLGEIARKHYYYGRTIGLFLSKNKKRGLEQVNPVRLAYLRHYKEFLKHPILSVGFIIYQVVRYAAGFFGIISTKI